MEAVLGGGRWPEEELATGARGRASEKFVMRFLGITGRSPASMLEMCSANCFYDVYKGVLKMKRRNVERLWALP